MKNINDSLNSTEVLDLLRRYHVRASSIEGIREGYITHGAAFMMKVVKAIAPGSVLSGNYGEDTNYGENTTYGGSDEMGPPTQQQYDEQNSTVTGWDKWVKALEMIGHTGVVLGGVKDNLLGNTPDPAQAAINAAADAKKKKSNTIIFIVAALILVIVAGLLIFKK